MEFLVIALVWWIIGSLGCLFLHFKYDEEISVGNLFISLYTGVLGPIGIMITAAVNYGDITLYRKK